MMNIPESLPRRLLEQLKSDGLKEAFFLPDRSLLLRAAAAIPYVNAQKGGEANGPSIWSIPTPWR